eukprot:TRINITY_DN145_c0_g1_i2.p1 TRINITY_DN145_c0_g1~~TRINITY_DN145_c0_g1_i2.p1  ORF type:complete len:559 (-),score=166.70 TRINITY_DN145_c0_g1_i2:41-1693(-)
MRSICFIVLLLTTAILCERINIPLENKAPIRGHVTLEHESFESDDPSIVQTAAGTVRGLVKDTHREFLGIMFAAPPTGQDRWAPPRPRSPWNGVFNATKFGAGCPQDCSLPPHTCPETISEDCLSLNVFTPASEVSNAPVMFFIPGGRFEEGTAHIDLYNGEVLANTSGVIVVVINYRLGALGFTCSNTDVLKTCNNGFLDQQLALKWVNQNIAAFGGNPNAVTIFGESAGGTSVATHMQAPGSWPYFHRAIMESNPIGIPIKSVKEAQTTANDFFGDLGCDSNECLMGKTWQEIVAAQNKAGDSIPFLDPILLFLPYSPTHDGETVLNNPLAAWNQGYNISLLSGTVREEALLFIYTAFTKPIDRFKMDAVVTGIFGVEHAHRILETYPETSNGTQDSRIDLAPLATDNLFVCSLRHALAQETSGAKQYRYMFDHVIWDKAWGKDYAECYGHVCHSSELPYVFGTAALDNFTYTAQEKVLVDDMVAYWTNFAINGDPNVGHPVSVQWPEYQPSQDNILHLKADSEGSVMLNNYRKEQCDMWDSVGYQIE